MTENLLQTADALPAVPKAAADEYGTKRELLVAMINERMLERPDIEALVGPDNLQMMKDNHANHALFIESMLQNFNSEVLVNTVLWVFRVYRSRRFHLNYWAAQLNAWVEVLKKELSSQSADAVLPLYAWMIVNIPHFTQLTDDGAGEDVA